MKIYNYKPNPHSDMYYDDFCDETEEEITFKEEVRILSIQTGCGTGTDINFYDDEHGCFLYGVTFCKDNKDTKVVRREISRECFNALEKEFRNDHD